MRIGIDIDETITDTIKSFNKVVKKYKLNLQADYDNIWTKEAFKIISPYFLEILSNSPLKKGAKEAIEKLNEMGHELYIITARSNRYQDLIEEMTIKLINDNNLKFKEIYFSQDIKSDLAKKLNIDLMIDDSIDVYNNMKKEGIDCILFKDKIKNWEDVLEYVKRKGGYSE